MFARWGLCIFLCLPFSAGAQIKLGHGPAHAEFEADFQKLITGGNAKFVRERFLDRLLKVRYRTELYLEAFEAELAKGQPLAEMQSYASLLAAHSVRDAADDEGVYIYRRAIETGWSGKGSEAGAKTCVLIVADIFDWIRERSEEDRLMISDWIDQIEQQSVEGHDTDASNAKPGKGRKVASALPTFNFAEYNFGHQDNLSQLFQKHKDEIKKNAEATRTWKDKELDDTLASYQYSRADSKRSIASVVKTADANAPPAAAAATAPAAVPAEPAATPPAAAAPGAATAPPAAPAPTSPAFYRPSIGKDGTFNGDHMPPQNFSFTFDDGPHPHNTDRVIEVATGYRDTVNPKGVPLTFFWLEQCAALYPQQIQHAKALGFVMNNHSWTHVDFGKVAAGRLHVNPQDVYRHEVIDANTALRAQYGVQPALKSDAIPYYRCPYGACIFAHNGAGVPEVRKMIADLGMIHILWNIDSMDWANIKNPVRTRDITIAQLERIENGVPVIGHGVILMHDIKDRTPDAFRMVLDWIKQKNDKGAHITLVPVTTAIAQANGAVARTMQ